MAGIEGYFGPELTDEDFEDYQFPVRVKQKFDASKKLEFAKVQYPQPVPRDNNDILVQQYAELGVRYVALIAENVLSHPFIVLRRQCQVNHNSRKFHVVPITLIPVIIHLYQRQGITTLWKGLGSVLIIRGATLLVEDFISKVTPLPKNVSLQTDSFKKIFQHVALKCITLVIITPFYSASLVETVQSDIASEKPGFFDVFKEGLFRLISFGLPQKGRMLPVWTLVVPTVLCGMCKHFFGSIVKSVSSNIMHLNNRIEYQKRGAFPKDYMTSPIIQEIDVSAQLISLIAAESVFYPLETILHRLHLQGTRTIIDNLDTGLSVTPILTSYEGMMDCYETTISQEGGIGLFKGFGAVILQFAVHYAFLKLSKLVFAQLPMMVKSSKPPQPTQVTIPQTIPIANSQNIVR